MDFENPPNRFVKRMIDDDAGTRLPGREWDFSKT